MQLRNWQVRLPLGIAGLVLGLLLATQMRATVEIQKQTKNSSRRYQSLIKVVDQARNKQNQMSTRVENLRKQLEAYKKGVVETAKVAEINNQINQVKIVTGELPVEGPGLYITLDDRETTATQVFSGDVKDIINILRYSGAEAIAVNGQRIVANTAVHEAGRNLLINKVPINRSEGIPYEVLAVGDPDNMESFLRVTYGLLADLQGAGVKIKITKVERVVTPAYRGGSLAKLGIGDE